MVQSFAKLTSTSETTRTNLLIDSMKNLQELETETTKYKNKLSLSQISHYNSLEPSFNELESSALYKKLTFHSCMCLNSQSQ